MAAKKTAKPKAEPQLSPCKCGCGVEVARSFKQGHDQRLVSDLASDLVRGDVWNGTCMGILKKTQVRADLQEKINLVVERVRAGISDALAAKVERAAHRQWELEKGKSERAAKKAERKVKAAAEAAKPKVKRPTKPVATNADIDALEAAQEAAETEAEAEATPDNVVALPTKKVGPGDAVRVRVGKSTRIRNATVRGMNQAGKITAVVLKNGDKELVKTEGEFEIVNG